MKDSTPLNPLAHDKNFTFKYKQHSIHVPKGPEKYNYKRSVDGQGFKLQTLSMMIDTYIIHIMCIYSVFKKWHFHI